MWSMKIVKGVELAGSPVIELPFPQPLGSFSIGRDKAATWALDDRTLALSGRHCEVVDTAAGPALRDLSTNGTFVNGSTTRLAGEHLLRDGDRIEMGPFVFLVSGPPMPERPAAALSPLSAPARPPRSPGVTDTAPHRGGDPAAMQAAGATGASVGLTEILRAARPAADSGADLTKIRLVTPPSSSSALSSAPSSSIAPGSAPPVLDGGARHAALARGLGLPPSALSGHDALQLAEGLARTAQAAAAALRQLLEHRARDSRGSRSSVAAPEPDSNPLRAAPSAEAAAVLLALTPGGPQEVLQRTVHELSAHEDRLRSALRKAAQHLADACSGIDHPLP